MCMVTPSDSNAQSSDSSEFQWQETTDGSPDSNTDELGESHPVTIEQSVAGDTYPIAVQKTVSGVTYVGLKQAAPDDSIESWLEDLATGVLQDALAEAHAGATEAQSKTEETEAISWIDGPDTAAIEVTVETKPESQTDTGDLALGDALMNSLVGATTTELASSATIRLDLTGDAASCVREYVDNSADFSTPIEFLTHTVFDTAFSP